MLLNIIIVNIIMIGTKIQKTPSKTNVQISIFTIIIIQKLERDNIISTVIKGSVYHTWTRHEFKTYLNEEKYINAKLQNGFDAFGKRYDENQTESCTVTKYNRQRIISIWMIQSEQKYGYDQKKLSIIPKMSRRQKMEMRKSLEVRSKGERGFNKIYWAKNMFRWRKIYECKQARQNMRMTKSLKVRIGRRGLLGGFNKVFWAPPISNPSDSNTNSI